eukprot:GEMP01020010.1.p1 GENE.GEMP01020010.1~~GEMP01020010.1.p1  ORF type:complete len:124 (+),score=38.43 GEMP01020010.1:143-514(+)
MEKNDHKITADMCTAKPTSCHKCSADDVKILAHKLDTICECSTDDDSSSPSSSSCCDMDQVKADVDKWKEVGARLADVLSAEVIEEVEEDGITAWMDVAARMANVFGDLIAEEEMEEKARGGA